MRLELLDNGVDSMKFGLEFYNKYLDLEDKYSLWNPGYLKMAVISFHNALELFSKKLLSSENELLIYRDLSNETLLNLLHHKKKIEKDIPLDWYVISDQVNILTIDYIECIKRLSIIFNLSKAQYKTLESMGNLRNKVTHFGLNKLIDFHEILVVTNEALELIAGFFYKNLKSAEKKGHPLDVVYDELINTLEKAEVEEVEAWETFYADNFEKINEIFDSLNENEQFKTELLTKGYTFNVEFGPYSHSSTIILKLINDKGETHVELASVNKPRLNSTIFADCTSSGPIYFVIDHQKMLEDPDNKKCCYIYHEPEEYEEYEFENEKFWEKDSQKSIKKSYGAHFDKEQLTRILIGIPSH
ncbi:hypothetical protein ACOSZH_24630 [Priestia megaterium]|uniref:hypothetical protein n=1 Tax=Priestia megaterium TaxID=1404 RepID=UPI003B9E8620